MKTVFAAALFSTTALVCTAHADDDRHCGNIPLEKWMSEEAIGAQATRLGIEVTRVKIDDGCYEVKGMRGSQRIEAVFHPETGAQVSIDGDD